MSSLLSGLVSYYALEGDATDSTGTNNGTVGSGCVFGTAFGKVNQGVETTYDGSGNIIAGTTGYPAGSSNRTCAHWLKTNGNIDTLYLTSGTDTGNPNEDCTFIVNGSGELWVAFGGGGTLWATAVVVNDNVWHLILFTWDGTNGNVYIDNVLVYTAGGTLNTIPTTLRFNIFDAGAGVMNFDEVGIWNRVLTVSEIDELWNGGVGLTYPFSTSAPTNASFLFNLL